MSQTAVATRRNHEVLFEPLRVGGATLQNRFVMCAMEGTNIIEGGQGFTFNEGARRFLLERARTGIGLMIPGMVLATYTGTEWLHEQEDLFMGPVKSLMDEIHRYGTKLFLQIGAGFGRVMSPVGPLDAIAKDPAKKAAAKAAGMDVDRIFESADANLPDVWDRDILTAQMSRRDIEQVVDSFGRTAALCRRAGIDGIEIHALHEGYLLDQFATAAMNHRTDEYGGSVENRARFATDIVRSIKAACGPDYPVSMRMSVESKMIDFNIGAVPGETYTEFGRGRDESVQIAHLLEDAGLDLLNADNGTYDSWYWAHPPVYMPLACNLDDVSYLKEHTGLPVVCAGRMEDPDIAAEAVSSGRIDAVGVARQFLADADYVGKVRDGAVEDIRPCIACHNGCFGVYHYKGLPVAQSETPLGRCAINPVAFQEEKYEIVPAARPKRIAVIGGGIGGMETARQAALRGHDVALHERSGRLGGVFTWAASPSFKEKDRMLIDWYVRQIEALPVTVHLNSEITSDDLAGIDANELVVATGARARDLPIPGIDGPHVMEAIDYLSGRPVTGPDVVVLGGGLTGCEIAYDLALKGLAPTIVEMQDDLLKVKNLSAANSNMLRDLIRSYRIGVEVNARATEISAHSVTISTPTGEQAVRADTVIVSAGYVPGAPLVEAAERLASSRSGKGPAVHVVGDAMAVGNLKDVIWRAYDVALEF